MDIVAVAKGTRRRTSKRALAGLAALGVIGIAGLVAGWGASPVEPIALAPADVVALRFPADWNDDDDTATTPAATLPAIPSGSYALASAGERDAALLFSPRPSFPQVRPRPEMAAAPSVAPAIVVPSRTEPTTELKAEPKTESKTEPKSQAKLEPKPAAMSEPKPARVAAATPEPRPAPRARKDSGALFNAAQLASIKSRLRLSPNQEEYWPAVESALRDIGWKATHDDTRKPGARPNLAATIDPNSDEVQRLKSAAFPLIMSMNEDQKREVRMLAQVMGLQQVAASF
jgi:hypothetical protein